MSAQAYNKSFAKGDVVVMVRQQSKPKWNNKTALIIGSFDRIKQRWPIRLNFGKKECALLKAKNLQKASQSDSRATFNVVEIQSNRGEGYGPLLNKLRNKSMTVSQWTKHVEMHKMKAYKSQFASLLGYDLFVYVDPKSRDNENNAASVFLTCALSNGFSPYQQLWGNSIVFCENKVITSDRLCGILDFISEAMDYYTEDYSVSEIKSAIAREAAMYKLRKWPSSGGSGGIDYYNDDTETCKLGRSF